VSLKAEVIGTAKMIEAFEKYGDLAVRALAGEMYLEAEATMTEAKQETPVDTGALRASGTVLLPEITGDEVLVQMGFGGAAVDYAIYVHEDLEKNHPVGKAKFLEDPLNRRVAGMTDRIAAGMARRLG
jgi:hypothetical protein